MKTKQIIVMIKFPNMRTGKYCAQASHASMAFLTKDIQIIASNGYPVTIINNWKKEHAEEIKNWINNSFKKIVCYVNSEEELKQLHEKAIEMGLISHLITDSGLTEFNGVPTITALAIGPHKDEKFEGLTNNLPLF